MKIKNLVPALVLSTVVVPATSMAETTANIGWVSEYLYQIGRASCRERV